VEFFSFKNGELYAEGVALTALAAREGTPLYVYSRGALESRFRAFDRALADVPHVICYAMKANANLAVLATFARLGGGFDIVTGGELFRAVRAGGDPRKIVYSGVGKSEAEIAYALEQGILMFNVESAEELAAIDRVAGRLGKQAPISLRVNPDVDPQTHPYISTGLKKSKFGVNLSQAREVYRDALTMANLAVVGVDCHIGSQLTKLAPFMDSLAKVLPLIDELRAAGAPVRYLDFGGGLGISYADETPPSIEEYGRAVAAAVKGRGLTLILEPGRNLVGNAGVLVTRVLYNKAGEAKHFVIVDAAMNDLMRPALYDAFHHIQPVVEKAERSHRLVDVVGPVCESGDFLAKDRKVPEVEAGELLAVMSAGAYGFSMSSQYNGRPRVAEVLVSGDVYDVVRRRESFEDLVRGEEIPADLGTRA
jgi:diaminopimelate decarboxylase